MKGTTKSGFSYDIPEEVLDDMELLEGISRIDENLKALPAVVSAIMGDRKQALYDHVRKIHGRVSISAVSDEIAQMLSSAGETGKN